MSIHTTRSKRQQTTFQEDDVDNHTASSFTCSACSNLNVFEIQPSNGSAHPKLAAQRRGLPPALTITNMAPPSEQTVPAPERREANQADRNPNAEEPQEIMVRFSPEEERVSIEAIPVNWGDLSALTIVSSSSLSLVLSLYCILVRCLAMSMDCLYAFLIRSSLL